MGKNTLLELLDKKIMITGWKLAERMGAATAVGAAAGMLFTLKAGKKMPEGLKKASNTVTIEVHDLEKLKIERT